MSVRATTAVVTGWAVVSIVVGAACGARLSSPPGLPARAPDAPRAADEVPVSVADAGAEARAVADAGADVGADVKADARADEDVGAGVIEAPAPRTGEPVAVREVDPAPASPVGSPGVALDRSAVPLRSRHSVRVYLDRFDPNRAVRVDDFRVDETPRSPRGVRYVRLRGADGTMDVPFESVREIVMGGSVGRSGDGVRYRATVTLRDGRTARDGMLDLSSMRGMVNGVPWRVLLTARDDQGSSLYRIVFEE